MQFQVSPLPRAITLAVFAQNQSPGPVWKAETKPNLSGSKEKAKLILNAPNSEWKKQLGQFIDSLLYMILEFARNLLMALTYYVNLTSVII